MGLVVASVSSTNLKHVLIPWVFPVNLEYRITLSNKVLELQVIELHKYYRLCDITF